METKQTQFPGFFQSQTERTYPLCKLVTLKFFHGTSPLSFLFSFLLKEAFRNKTT